MSSAAGRLAHSLGSVSELRAAFNDKKRELDREEVRARQKEDWEEIKGQRQAQCLSPSATERLIPQPLRTCCTLQRSCPHGITHTPKD